MSMMRLPCRKFVRCIVSQTSVRTVSRALSSRVNTGTKKGVPQTKRRVFSFGSGANGALGTSGPPFADAYEPELVTDLPPDIVSIAAGHYHSLALTSSGSLWTWGRNTEGQLGPRKATTDTAVEDWCPRKVDGLEGVEVVGAAASGVVSMAWGADGSLWAMGKSKRGQLGLGLGVVNSPEPKRVLSLHDRQVTQVALGWGHALACTADKEVFGWGYPNHGRLGLGPPPASDSTSSPATSADAPAESWGHRIEEAERFVAHSMEGERDVHLEWTPRKVVSLEGLKVAEVACGMDHSLALCGDGTVLCFGDNGMDQLGLPPHMEYSHWPVKIPAVNAAQVACGLGHSLALAKQHPSVVFSWGDNMGGQLGTEGGGLLPVAGLEGLPIVKISGGRVHSCALSAEGEVWSWGSGRNGRLGQGSSRDSPQPGVVEGLEGWRVVGMACGFDHTLLLVEGRGDGSQVCTA